MHLGLLDTGCQPEDFYLNPEWIKVVAYNCWCFSSLMTTVLSISCNFCSCPIPLFSSSLSPKSQNRWGRAFRRHPSLLLMLTPLFRQRLKAGNYQWRVRPAWTWDPTTVVLPTTAALARYYRLSRCVIFPLVGGDERRSSTQRWSKKYNPDAFSSRNGVL